MDGLISSLTEKRYFVSDEFIPESLSLALQDEALSLLHQKQYEPAKIGSRIDKERNTKIRSDKTSWLSRDEEEQSSAQKDFLKIINNLMDTLNPLFYLGLRKYEGHYAYYNEGAYYKKHVDQHKGVGSRRLSTILYLTDMQEGQGGELVLYDWENPELIFDTIRPQRGRFVCFLSEDFYHEVLPAHSARISLTGWLRSVHSL